MTLSVMAISCMRPGYLPFIRRLEGRLGHLSGALRGALGRSRAELRWAGAAVHRPCHPAQAALDDLLRAAVAVVRLEDRVRVGAHVERDAGVPVGTGSAVREARAR